MLAGVDIGVRLVTVCRIDFDGAPSWSRLEVPKRLDSLQAARAIAVLAAETRWPPVVWVERSMGRHLRSVADLGRVVGAILAGMPAETSVSEIAPQDWKRLVGLPGNAAKPMVGAWAFERTRLELDEHEADAFAIATACCIASERHLRLLDGGRAA